MTCERELPLFHQNPRFEPMAAITVLHLDHSKKDGIWATDNYVHDYSCVEYPVDIRELTTLTLTDFKLFNSSNVISNIFSYLILKWFTSHLYFRYI